MLASPTPWQGFSVPPRGSHDELSFCCEQSACPCAGVWCEGHQSCCGICVSCCCLCCTHFETRGLCVRGQMLSEEHWKAWYRWSWSWYRLQAAFQCVMIKWLKCCTCIDVLPYVLYVQHKESSTQRIVDECVHVRLTSSEQTLYHVIICDMSATGSAPTCLTQHVCSFDTSLLLLLKRSRPSSFVLS